MRKAYIRIKLPEELVDYVAYVVDRRLLGYRSMIEFCAAATRKEVQRLRRLDFIPPVVPKVREVPVGAIGVLSVAFGIVLIGLLFWLPGNIVGLGVLEDVFGPFAGWDVASTYVRFQGVINFALYFVSFFAVLFSVTKKWLDRREAVLLAAAFSTAFSVGLALMPVSWLKQLGPFALLVIALLLFYAVFEALKHFGFAGISSGSIAYILAFLLVRTHRPDLFAPAGGFGSVLNIAFLIAFLVAVFKAGAELLTKSEGVLARAGHAVRGAKAEVFGTPEERALLAREQAELAQFLKIEPSEEKLLDQLEKDIERSRQAIRKYGFSREALASIAHELVKLRDQETELGKKLEDLHEVAQRVQAIDIEAFTKLKNQYAQLSPEQQEAIKKKIEERVTELNLTAVLPRLAQASRDTHAQANTSLNTAINQLERNQAHDAMLSLDRVRYFINQLRAVLTQVKEAEQAVQRLLAKKLTYFQRP